MPLFTLLPVCLSTCLYLYLSIWPSSNLYQHIRPSNSLCHLSWFVPERFASCLKSSVNHRCYHLWLVIRWFRLPIRQSLLEIWMSPKKLIENIVWILQWLNFDAHWNKLNKYKKYQEMINLHHTCHLVPSASANPCRSPKASCHGVAKASYLFRRNCLIYIYTIIYI